MSNKVSVTNRALQAIGTRSTIAAMTEDSNEAKNATLCYDAVRQQLIRAAPWNMATATATLSLIKSAPGTIENTGTQGVWDQASQPPPGWLYEYLYPADCLRARKVVPNTLASVAGGVPIFPAGVGSLGALPLWNQRGVRFQVATDLNPTNNPFTCILANIDQAILCYLRDVTVEDVWDPSFEEAMVQALGGHLCMALTGDKQLTASLYKQANQIIVEARANDGNEGLTVVDDVPDWIRAHGISYGVRDDLGFCAPYGSLFL